MVSFTLCRNKKTNVTTKLGVFFDGSAKTSASTSLNDILLVTSEIRDDIFSPEYDSAYIIM